MNDISSYLKSNPNMLNLPVDVFVHISANSKTQAAQKCGTKAFSKGAFVQRGRIIDAQDAAKGGQGATNRAFSNLA